MRTLSFCLFFLMLSLGAFYGGNVHGQWEDVSSELCLEEDSPVEDVLPQKHTTRTKKNVTEPPEIKEIEPSTEESAEPAVEQRSYSDVESCSFIEALGGTCFGVNMGWNCRFQKTSFIMGLIFGGAVAVHRKASIISDPIISNCLTLGYFDVAFRFGFAFYRALPFIKFGWCVDRYSFDIMREDGEIALGKSWFNGFLYGVGCDLNLSRSLSVGVAVDLHSAFGHTLDFFVEEDTKVYRPYSLQYFVTIKYQMTK